MKRTLAAVALLATMTGVFGSAPVAAADPLVDTQFYVDPASDAQRELARPHTAAEKAALQRIASHANSRWYGDWVPTNQIAQQVASYTTAAAETGRMPVMTLYAIPGRDCGNYSAGGLHSAAEYAAWTNQVSAGLGTRKAVVIVEPDALAQADCLSSTARTARYTMIKNAVTKFRTANSHSTVYIDAGNSHWQTATTMAPRLTAAGISQAQGFATGVSNFYPTRDEIAYGKALSARVSGKHFVIDTSRNKNGAYTGTMQDPWCNPPGRGLGTYPTTSTGTGNQTVDAFLWIKIVGQSDGECGRGNPPAGQWWWQYAVGLATN